jgi:hypothetical protein
MKSVLGSCAALVIGADDAACNDIFDGTLPAGAECNGAVCASHAFCYREPDQPGQSGHCIEPVLAGAHGLAGDSCVGNCVAREGAMDCTTYALPTDPPPNFCYADENVHCVPSEREAGDQFAHPYRCVRFAQVGEPCSSLTSCVSGAFCNVRTCANQDDSAACSNLSYACTDGKYCDATGNCSPKKPDGASCSNHRDCSSNKCSAHGICGSNVTPATCAGNFYDLTGGV